MSEHFKETSPLPLLFSVTHSSKSQVWSSRPDSQNLELPHLKKSDSPELKLELRHYVNHYNQQQASQNTLKRRAELEHVQFTLDTLDTKKVNEYKKKQRCFFEKTDLSKTSQKATLRSNYDNKSFSPPPQLENSGSMSCSDHINSAKMEFANSVLENILTPPYNATINQYKTYLIEWKKYCDSNFRGDCDVTATKMLNFFLTAVFTRKVKKFVDPKTGYHGQTSLKSECKWKPMDVSGKLDSANWQHARALAELSLQISNAAIQSSSPPSISSFPPSSFSPYSIPPPSSSSSNEQYKHLSKVEDITAHSACGNIDLHDVHSEVDDHTKISVDTDDYLEQDRKSDCLSTSSATPKIQEDRHGRKIIEVPVGPETVDCAMKALVFLWKQQSSNSSEYRNTASNPRRDIPLMEAIEEYKTAFILGKSAQDKIGSNPSRDSYSEQQFISMILNTWCMLPLNRNTCTRNYNIVNRFPYMREHLSLLARHHMLLRDEEIRSLNLSDISAIQTPCGTSKADGIVFRISPNKSGLEGRTTYALAYRHKNFIRCTISALAFYMLERFEVEKEVIPEFFDPDQWHEIKLLRAFGNSKEKQANRKDVLSSTTQIDSTRSVMRSCGVYTPMATHSGRHAGTLEGEHLGLSRDDMRHLGRQCLSSSEASQVTQIPIVGSLTMAHFKSDEQVFLERDLVIPPLALQRMIFPWIEHSFNKDLPERTQSWIEECELEMSGLGTRSDRDKYLHTTHEESRGITSRASDDIISDRIGFLQLLVKLRRVILQDSVLYLKPDQEGKTLSNDLIRSLSHIFQSRLFFDYQVELLAAIEKHHKSGKSSYSTRDKSAIDVDPSKPTDPVTPILSTDQMVANTLQSIVSDIRGMKQEIMRRCDEQDTRIDSLQVGLKSIREAIGLDESEGLPLHPIATSSSLPPQPNLFQPRQSFPINHRPLPRHGDLYLQGTVPNYVAHPHEERQYPPGRHTFYSQDYNQYRQHNYSQRHHLSHQTSQYQPYPPHPHPYHNVSMNPSSPFRGSDYGYRMIPDNGYLRPRQAWDEFYGPIAQALNHDANWPHDDYTWMEFQKRSEFIHCVKENAQKSKVTPEEYLDFMEVKYRDRNINGILYEQKNEQKVFMTPSDSGAGSDSDIDLEPKAEPRNT